MTNATGVSFDAEAESETVEAVPGLSPTEFVETLRKLQSTQETTGPLERNLIKTMIDQMEGQVQAGVQHVGVDVIQGYLDRMSESEEAFVQVVDEQPLTLTAQLSSLADPASLPGGVPRHHSRSPN